MNLNDRVPEIPDSTLTYAQRDELLAKNAPVPRCEYREWRETGWFYCYMTDPVEHARLRRDGWINHDWLEVAR
jgi:hypothetical protein